MCFVCHTAYWTLLNEHRAQRSLLASLPGSYKAVAYKAVACSLCAQCAYTNQLPPKNALPAEASFGTVLFIFNFSNFQKLSSFEQFSIKMKDDQVVAFFAHSVYHWCRTVNILSMIYWYTASLLRTLCVRGGNLRVGYRLQLTESSTCSLVYRNSGLCYGKANWNMPEYQSIATGNTLKVLVRCSPSWRKCVVPTDLHGKLAFLTSHYSDSLPASTNWQVCASCMMESILSVWQSGGEIIAPRIWRPDVLGQWACWLLPTNVQTRRCGINNEQFSLRTRCNASPNGNSPRVLSCH